MTNVRQLFEESLRTRLGDVSGTQRKGKPQQVETADACEL
jgi:hypothetical protein